MWVFGQLFVYEKGQFSKIDLKRARKKAVMYVREMENNAEARRRPRSRMF